MPNLQSKLCIIKKKLKRRRKKLKYYKKLHQQITKNKKYCFDSKGI